MHQNVYIRKKNCLMWFILCCWNKSIIIRTPNNQSEMWAFNLNNRFQHPQWATSMSTFHILCFSCLFSHEIENIFLDHAPVGSFTQYNLCGWITVEISLYSFEKFIEFSIFEKSILFNLDNHSIRAKWSTCYQSRSFNKCIPWAQPNCSNIMQQLDFHGCFHFQNFTRRYVCASGRSVKYQ